MDKLSYGTIRNNVADSEVIFSRGENLFSLGNYTLTDSSSQTGSYSYSFDGNYGDYRVSIMLSGNQVSASCSCPYPHDGCKHIVAACLDILHRQKRAHHIASEEDIPQEYLTPEEIKEIALASRKERAKKEKLKLYKGDSYKGIHEVWSPSGRMYRVTLYNPQESKGHCTCPDYASNHLEICKHIIFTANQLSKEKNFAEQVANEVFPFIHITWNSRQQKPTCYYESISDPALLEKIESLFNEKGIYTNTRLSQLYKLFHEFDGESYLRFDAMLLNQLEDMLYEKEIKKISKQYKEDFSFLSVDPYSYQKEGVRFALFKKSAIIADEMGLGKTLQAISIAYLKKQLFGFTKILVISPSSLKEQWKREIEKFTEETTQIIAGSRKKRKLMYEEDRSFFKITNYEAVLRDVTTIAQWKPDLIILDEAQRIKNFATKTHQAILSLPHNHSLVITGTPLENKLEDIYAIAQFARPGLLTPLWAFAANHFNLSRSKKNTVLGYKNLEIVHEKLKELVIRRRKEDVFEVLPDKMVNNYYLDLSKEQDEIHGGYVRSLAAIIRKKVLTPMDIKKLQMILLSMRMVCDSTYLIDKVTNISPKLVELVSLLKELVLENKRKVIIFSEWTTMTYLIGKVLSELGIKFVEFTGKVPVPKRQSLVEEFQNNPECMVFLSTDAGGLGLNLQNTDCLINFELPWNPAKLNQRIGRINRIGQKSGKINIINLISKASIEEKVLAGINLKQELFDAVLEGEGDEVDFSQQSKQKFINQIRELFNEEELLESPRGKTEPPELDEQTPHYLNPEVFRRNGNEIDLASEEYEEPNEGPQTPSTADRDASRISEGQATQAENPPSSQKIKPDQIESVLSQGLAFLNTLSQMATGQPLVESEDQKSISIDQNTGEVVLRFKLPNVGKQNGVKS